MSRLTDEVSSIRRNIKEVTIPPDLTARIEDQLAEVTRLESDISARVHVEQMLRYINWVMNLPWNSRSKDTLDLKNAKEILDKHHYGLDEVKDRILEYLSVLKLNIDRWEKESQEAMAKDKYAVDKDAKLSHAILARRAPILCLVGLVGTGKTTLAKSIAEAMGRRYDHIR